MSKEFFWRCNFAKRDRKRARAKEGVIIATRNGRSNVRR